MKKIAIVQSNYIPWKGYFDLIAAVDDFVLYDDVQYTRRDWRNRNRIKTPIGAQWLTVPVKTKGKYHQTIRETEIDGKEWARAHWLSLASNYRKAAHFAEVAALVEPVYRGQHTHLSDLNRSLIEAICVYLGIATRIGSSSNYCLKDERSGRLAAICADAGATEYISGPAAKDYLDVAAFARRGIEVTWFDYHGYPEYPQLWGAFIHEVTILDLLFNCGKDAGHYMKFVPETGRGRT